MSDAIKKSLLITLTFPPRFGGIEAYYHRLCQELPADKIVVLAPTMTGEDDFDRNQHYTIIRKPMINPVVPRWPRGWFGLIKLATTIRWLSLIRSIDHAVRLHHIELIQAGQVLPLGTLALWYFKKRKLPYIFYAHGLDITLPQHFMRKKTLLKKIIINAQAIIANSEYTRQELIALGAAPKQVTVIYPCPNIIATNPNQTVVDNLTANFQLAGKQILLTVARLVERKGHDMVIRALPKIIRRVPNVKYIILGDGPYRQKIEKIVNELKLGQYVQFVGARPQSEMSAWYDLADVFIMPARELPNGDVEGFGIVYLEANLFAKPVIGGKSGGVPEAIADNVSGLLVSPTNIDDIANAAIKLLTDKPLAHRLGMQGLDRVHKYFSWDKQAQALKKILSYATR